MLKTQPTGDGRIIRAFAPQSLEGEAPYRVIYNNVTAYGDYTQYQMSSEAV